MRKSFCGVCWLPSGGFRSPHFGVVGRKHQFPCQVKMVSLADYEALSVLGHTALIDPWLVGAPVLSKG